MKTWRKTRQAIFRFVRNLSETAWLQTGNHVTSGAITIRDVLISMLEHDREHLEDLQLKVGKYEESLNLDG